MRSLLSLRAFRADSVFYLRKRITFNGLSMEENLYSSRGSWLIQLSCEELWVSNYSVLDSKLMWCEIIGFQWEDTTGAILMHETSL